MKIELEHCKSWEIELVFSTVDHLIKIGIPSNVGEIRDMQEDPRGWIEINTGYPPVDLLDDAVEIFKLVNDEEFIKDLEVAIKSVVWKYIICKDNKRGKK